MYKFTMGRCYWSLTRYGHQQTHVRMSKILFCVMIFSIIAGMKNLYNTSYSGSKGEISNDSVIYIAMAGTHQIWVLYLEDGSWLKGG